MSVVAGSAEAARVLARYQWQARVLVVSSPSADDPALLAQVGVLSVQETEVRARDLILVRAVGNDARDSRGAPLDASAVRASLSLPADRFAVVLLGKDGGVKLRSDKPFSLRELFDTIDAMPMRQHEMRHDAMRERR